MSNEGKTISEDLISDIFKPFQKDVSNTGNTGLGLGLYIASEISKAHFGTLTVDSKEDKTCFTFRVDINLE